MSIIHLLSAVLAIQAQAVALGAPVQGHILTTQEALCRCVAGATTQVCPPPAETAPEPVQEPEKAPATSWDPEPHEIILDSSRCRALLLEVVRRAAHDWVLYRNTRKPERVFAREAFTWLFEEEPGHPWWELRHKEGEPLLAFLNICEVLDLDPEVVRKRVRAMTIRDITSAGRPAERRRSRNDGVSGIEDYETPTELDLSSLDDPSILSDYGSSYEAQFAAY